jgi:F-type H+-transporting ATPase subunit b
MLDAGSMSTTGTVSPPKQEGGFPPFDARTFPSQIFWLTLTFAFLFMVLWRFAAPRISGAITTRRDQINGDVKAAEQHRKDADGASAAYETALAGARGRAQTLAEENRKRIDGEVAAAKASADADAHKATAEAEVRIAASRAEAKTHVIRAAQEAAADIVTRLTGDSVSAEDAASAVQAALGN